MKIVYARLKWSYSLFLPVHLSLIVAEEAQNLMNFRQWGFGIQARLARLAFQKTPDEFCRADKAIGSHQVSEEFDVAVFADEIYSARLRGCPICVW
jgi:hypothetical protein